MSREIKLLLVEDNPADAKLTSKMLNGLNTPHKLHVVRDGIEAMEYVKNNLTDLIFLDLNLPRKDGREFLKELKSDPELNHIPVIVLTTSGADKDIQNSYELHANCFVRKPVSLEEFRKVMIAIEAFWFQTAILPPTKPS
jgi:chemotaxis family two-component system response regulator Rcp1